MLSEKQLLDYYLENLEIYSAAITFQPSKSLFALYWD